MFLMNGTGLLEQVKKGLMEETMEFSVFHGPPAIAHQNAVSNRKTGALDPRSIPPGEDAALFLALGHVKNPHFSGLRVPE